MSKQMNLFGDVDSGTSVVILKELLGKTLQEVIVDRKDESVLFVVSDKEKYKMYHDQDCCEKVVIESIVGDVNDLIGSPLVMAESVTEDGQRWVGYSSTWTFYKFATVKGYVTVKWFGVSDGYDSEDVSLERVL